MRKQLLNNEMKNGGGEVAVACFVISSRRFY
jgi:hypothetical protein